MSGVPAWIQPPAVAAYAGTAPATAAEDGSSFAKMVLAGIVGTAIVLWVKGKVAERNADDESFRLYEEAEEAQRELDNHREDLAIAHDWTTAHPLAVRYGQ